MPAPFQERKKLHHMLADPFSRQLYPKPLTTTIQLVSRSLFPGTIRRKDPNPTNVRAGRAFSDKSL
jgi:hypothetical protein